MIVRYMGGTAFAPSHVKLAAPTHYSRDSSELVQAALTTPCYILIMQGVSRAKQYNCYLFRACLATIPPSCRHRLSSRQPYHPRSCVVLFFLDDELLRFRQCVHPASFRSRSRTRFASHLLQPLILQYKGIVFFVEFPDLLSSLCKFG
jgi:hypothetical protein